MCHVVHAIQYCYWLGPLSNNGRSAKRHKMDPFYYTWRPRLRRWFSSIVPPTTAHSGKDRPVSMFSNQVGLRISLKKTEAMCVNVLSPTKIRVRGQDIPYTIKFTYFGSVLCQDGGTSEDIQSRLNIARNAFISLRSECWLITEQDLSKLASFQTANVRKILRIFWSQKISNDQLLRWIKQEDIRTLVNRRRWRWIGHVMRKASNNIARIAMHWTPEGKRSRGRPKTTWRRTVEKRLRELKYSWSTIENWLKINRVGRISSLPYLPHRQDR